MYEILYGRHAVREVLRAGRRRVHRIFLAREARETKIIRSILDLARQRQVPVQRVPRLKLDQMGSNAHHQGIMAEVNPYPYADLEDLLRVGQERGEPTWLLLLDNLQDPQNVGALLRTAEAAGVHGVVLPSRHAVGVTPAVVHISAGAAEHLLVARVTNLVRTIEALKEQEIWVIGLEAVPEAMPYHQVDLTIPLGLVIGSEGSGLRRLVRERCDLLMRLPMRGHIGSLNASVAGGIALYEVLRQRSTG